MALKQSIKQYRNINGARFEMYTADPSQFAQIKRNCKKVGLKFRVIDNQLYIQVK